MQRISLEEAAIQQPQGQVFRVLTETAFFARTSPSTRNVKGPPTLALGTRFTRTFMSHGIAQWQTLAVQAFETPRILSIETRLLLMRVRYDYALEELSGGRTRLTLRKEADLRAPWNGLLQHLLTASEHDGAHLQCICEVAESLSV